MPEFYEIDFLPVHTSKSGDAIAMRYQVDSSGWYVHVVDGGYSSTAPDLAALIGQTYGRISATLEQSQRRAKDQWNRDYAARPAMSAGL